MTSIKEKIQQKLKIALKEKQAAKVSVLRMLVSAIKNEEIASRQRKEGLADKKVIDIVARQIKQRRDSIEQFTKGDRQDLAEKEQAELKILQEFMPEQLSEEEVKKVVKEVIASGASGFGAVMGAVMGKLKGKADGNVVRKIVEQELS